MTPFQQLRKFILFNQWHKYIKSLLFKKERGRNRTIWILWNL